MYVHVYIYTYICIYIYIYIYIRICIVIYMYINIHTHTHIYIYMYTHIFIHIRKHSHFLTSLNCQVQFVKSRLYSHLHSTVKRQRFKNVCPTIYAPKRALIAQCIEIVWCNSQDPVLQSFYYSADLFAN